MSFRKETKENRSASKDTSGLCAVSEAPRPHIASIDLALRQLDTSKPSSRKPSGSKRKAFNGNRNRFWSMFSLSKPFFLWVAGIFDPQPHIFYSGYYLSPSFTTECSKSLPPLFLNTGTPKNRHFLRVTAPRKNGSVRRFPPTRPGGRATWEPPSCLIFVTRCLGFLGVQRWAKVAATHPTQPWRVSTAGCLCRSSQVLEHRSAIGRTFDTSWIPENISWDFKGQLLGHSRHSFFRFIGASVKLFQGLQLANSSTNLDQHRWCRLWILSGETEATSLEALSFLHSEDFFSVALGDITLSNTYTNILHPKIELAASKYIPLQQIKPCIIPRARQTHFHPTVRLPPSLNHRNSLPPWWKQRSLVKRSIGEHSYVKEAMSSNVPLCETKFFWITSSNPMRKENQPPSKLPQILLGQVPPTERTKTNSHFEARRIQAFHLRKGGIDPRQSHLGRFSKNCQGPTRLTRKQKNKVTKLAWKSFKYPNLFRNGASSSSQTTRNIWKTPGFFSFISLAHRLTNAAMRSF